MKYSVITFKSNETLDYKFLGSAIRGVFGTALKKVVCINPSKECSGCFASSSCLFYDFYEKDNPKYRINLEIGGKLEFDLFLYEEYSLKAPYVISALHNAFTQIGITKKRIKPDFKLYFNGHLIFDGEFKKFENRQIEFDEKNINPKSKTKLFLKTPLRIKENNRFVRDKIKLETILRSIYHRSLKLQNKPIEKLPFSPKYNIKDERLSFIDFTRRSNRQKTKMQFGGLIGEIEFDYIDENSYKLLKLGEIIGVGKQVTFGFGRIEVE
jgi:CRISPR-associated endoribonuclease Cas6